MSGKYKVYPEYKDSGVEWLSTIPEHWVCTDLKRYCKVTDGSHHSPKIQDHGKPFVSVTDVGQDDIDFHNCKRITIEDYDRLVIEGCKPKVGEILLTKDGTIGRAVVVKDEYPQFVILSSLGLLTPSRKIHNYYLYYYLVSGINIDQMNSLIHGSALRRMTISKIENLVLNFPDLLEQAQIANFLDHETAKIDTLVEKQKQLIKLLKEKRQAVISHAVTKGLNPDAPMQDSGVEWLGEVPKHWEVKPLRFVGSCQNGINIGAEYFGTGYPFVSYGDVYRNDQLPEIVNGLVQSTDIDRILYMVVEGDILFTRTSETVEEIGFASTCLKKIEDSTFAGFLIRVRPFKNTLFPGFSRYYFRSVLLRTFFVKEMNLVTRASLSQDLLKKLPVVLPPITEQKRIAEYLNSKSRTFNQLIRNAEQAINLLHERRTALISAAVTGKIDVRDWKPPT